MNLQYLSTPTYNGSSLRTLFADTLGYIPRHEALKIPQLKVQENENKAALTKNLLNPVKQLEIKQKKGKKQSDYEEENADENQFDQNMDMDVEDAENEIQNQIDVQPDDIDEQQQQDLEQNEIQNIQNQFQNEDPEEEDDQIDEDNEGDDLSEISRSISANVAFVKNKTKRQKGQLDDFLQLPLKKPRKDAKKFDQATQLIRKQEKQRKRRQYIKKLMEAQQKATFEKILNETGRKFRQRQQRQLKEVNQKDHKKYRTLGDVPKIVTKDTIEEGKKILINKTTLFPPQALFQPNIKMSQNCGICHQAIGKYKSKNGQRFCSIKCYKKIQQKENSQKRFS